MTQRTTPSDSWYPRRAATLGTMDEGGVKAGWWRRVGVVVAGSAEEEAEAAPGAVMAATEGSSGGGQRGGGVAVRVGSFNLLRYNVK
jgi:hypothetical protein